MGDSAACGGVSLKLVGLKKSADVTLKGLGISRTQHLRSRLVGAVGGGLSCNWVGGQAFDAPNAALIVHADLFWRCPSFVVFAWQIGIRFFAKFEALKAVFRPQCLLVLVPDACAGC